MASHNDFGKQGEEMAADWLAEKGYRILHRNWRYKNLEIDIIARSTRFLHFVEVKARQGGSLGHPEDSVSRKKFRQLQRAADAYLQLHPGDGWIRYDILSITRQKDGKVEYFLLEDVYL